MKNNIFTLSILFLCLLFISACSKESALDGIKKGKPNQPGNIAGMGDTDSELEGTTFHFGTDILIEGGIQGDDPDNPMKDYCNKTGSGSYVLLRFAFVNQSGKDTVLVLPAGLTFHSSNPDVQHGLLIQTVSIPLAKAQSCKTLIYAYCVNELRDTPDRSSTFTFGPINNAVPIVELINLLKNKPINYQGLKDDVRKDKANLVLQTAVWRITEGEGLTQEDKEFIKKL